MPRPWYEKPSFSEQDRLDGCSATVKHTTYNHVQTKVDEVKLDKVATRSPHKKKLRRSQDGMWHPSPLGRGIVSMSNQNKSAHTFKIDI